MYIEDSKITNVTQQKKTKNKMKAKVGMQLHFLSPQIANPQNLGLIPLSKIRKFLTCAVEQSATRKSSIFLWLIRKSRTCKFRG
jgi:hypothetical protein